MAEEVAQDMGTTGTSMEPKSPDAYKFDTSYHRFSSFLGVHNAKRGDRELAKKVSLVYDWAKDMTGADDSTSIMNAVRDYQKGLGVTHSGETLVNHLYRNIRLDMEGTKAQAEKDKLDGKIAKETDLKIKKVKKVKSEPVDVSKKVTKELAPEMKRVEKKVKEAVKRTMDQSVDKRQIDKKLAPVIKNVERQVKETIKINMNESIAKALKGMFK